ncbi:MAG: hypothetical protein R6V37_09995 [Psychroflexus maritimus]
MRIFTLLFVGVAFILGVSNMQAQNSNQEELQTEAKKKAMKISSELNLDDEQEMFIFRYVYNYRLQVQKLDQLEEGSEDYTNYEEQINQEMRMNLESEFGSEAVDKIIELFNKYK